MTKTNLLPDEIEVYHDKFGDLLAFKEFDLRVPGTRYVRADLVSTPNKPAEVDLDALKREVLQEYGGNGIVGSACIDDIEWVISYLHSSGHLATGKGGDE